MEGSRFWKTNSRSVNQEIRFLWNPKFHFCVDKSPSLTLILTQMTPTPATDPYHDSNDSNPGSPALFLADQF
jgi:hypothetical protein